MTGEGACRIRIDIGGRGGSRVKKGARVWLLTIEPIKTWTQRYKHYCEGVSKATQKRLIHWTVRIGYATRGYAKQEH
jgi:dissimilatory sulfite reductase (desulfoviridin) alpha/beta subunit